MDQAQAGRGGSPFGDRIKELRRAKGLTQRQVATGLGIDFTYLSKLENGRGEPPGEETVRGLATVLDGDPEELLALAGKVPGDLKVMAQGNVRFARMLRTLPRLTEEDLAEIYRVTDRKVE